MFHSCQVFHRKRITIFLFILIFLINCEKYSLEQNFFDIDLKIDNENIEVSLIEKLYYENKYSAIALLPKPEDKFQRYIYIRALFHLKEYEKVINDNFEFKDEILETYITFFKAYSLSELKRFDEAYKEISKIEERKDYINPESIQDLYEKIIANLNREELSKNKGRFYFYRFDILKKNEYLIKAVELKDDLALDFISSNLNLIPNSVYLNIFEYLKENKQYLALRVAEKLALKNELGELYFKNKKYDFAIKYLDDKDIKYSLSKIGMGKPNKDDIEKCLSRLEISFDILAEWYIKTKNYQMLYQITYETENTKYIREMILGLIEENRLDLIYEYCKKLKDKTKDIYTKTMLLYYAGIAKLKENSEEYKELLKEAALNTVSFYGYFSLEALSDKDKKDVFKKQREIYDSLKKGIKEKLEKIKELKIENGEYIKFFIKIGEYNRAFYLLKNTKDENLNYLFLAKIMFNLKRYRQSVFFINKLYEYISEYKLPYLQIITYLYPFPEEYKKIILEAKERYGIDQYLIAGLIRQESCFDPMAVSSAGAKGLTQLMPSTAKSILDKLYKEKVIKNTDLFDPHTNTMVGMYYLNYLFSIYQDKEHKEILSIASYNAGPTRIKKHYEGLKNILNEIHLIETIPILETREYTKRVFMYKEIYKRLHKIEKE